MTEKYNINSETLSSKSLLSFFDKNIEIEENSNDKRWIYKASFFWKSLFPKSNNIKDVEIWINKLINDYKNEKYIALAIDDVNNLIYWIEDNSYNYMYLLIKLLNNKNKWYINISSNILSSICFKNNWVEKHNFVLTSEIEKYIDDKKDIYKKEYYLIMWLLKKIYFFQKTVIYMK